jgi:hypothetical protein
MQQHEAAHHVRILMVKCPHCNAESVCSIDVALWRPGPRPQLIVQQPGVQQPVEQMASTGSSAGADSIELLWPQWTGIRAAADAAADAAAGAAASTRARPGPYGDKGKGKSDKGKGDSKGGEPHVCEDTDRPPSRLDALERRIYDLEGELAVVRRLVRGMLAGLDVVLPLPANIGAAP